MKSVLLVDDDAEFRRVVAAVVVPQGAELIEAGSGKEASQRLKQIEPSLIIVDGLLPDTNGIRWITTLRESKPDVPVVFVSAFGFSKDKKSYQLLTQDLKVAKIVPKPIDFKGLSEALSPFLVEIAKAAEVNTLPLLELDSALEDIGRDYARTLPGTIKELQAAAAQARQGPNDEAFALLRRRAHSLRGTAGSYGFSKVSQAADQLEQFVVDYPNRRDRAGFWRAVEQAIVELSQLADGAMTTTLEPAAT